MDKKEIIQEVIQASKKENYTKYPKGFFKNRPEMEGYIYTPSNKELNVVHIIINENPNFSYPKEITTIEGQVFLVYNTSIDKFISNFSRFSTKIAKAFKVGIKFKADAEVSDASLPYGYKKGSDGSITVDRVAAKTVREAYKMYSTERSIRKVAEALKLDFSTVRSMLVDDRYITMKPTIVSSGDYRKVDNILKQNIKKESKYRKEGKNRMTINKDESTIK